MEKMIGEEIEEIRRIKQWAQLHSKTELARQCGEIERLYDRYEEWLRFCAFLQDRRGLALKTVRAGYRGHKREGASQGGGAPE